MAAPHGDNRQYPSLKRLEEMKERPFHMLRKGTDNRAVQLAFDLFNNGVDDNDERHSHTVELFDIMPKYVPDTRRLKRSVSTDGKFQSLPDMERGFEYRNRKFTQIIKPARIKDKDGVYRDYYPGPRERVVEMALRKIAIDKRRTQLIEDWAGCSFSLYELQRELERIGRGMKYDELKHSIEVLHLSHIELADETGEVSVSSPILPMRGINEKQPDGGRVTYVLFHPMIRAAIERLDYRQHDYVLATKLKNHLAQYLHMRMVHRFTQANIIEKYTITASTILAGAGIEYARSRKGIEQVREALEELKEHQVILSIAATPITGARGALIDEQYEITPTHEFAREQKRANALQKEQTTRHDSRTDAQREASRELAQRLGRT